MNFYSYLIALWIVFVFAAEPPFAKRAGRTNRWTAVALTLLAVAISVYVWQMQIWFSPAREIYRLLNPLSP